MPFYYSAFCLVIKTDIELQELHELDPQAHDVEVVESVTALTDRSPGSSQFQFSSTHQYLAWPGVGEFEIVGGSRVSYRLRESVDPGLIAFPLLGPVFGLLLHLRGLLVFHASALAINGVGVILLGDKGAGKSTTAAAMVALGHKLLSDDIVAVDLKTVERPLVLPSYPQIKLTEGSRAILGQSPDLSRHPVIDKYLFSLSSEFAKSPIPPVCAFVLERQSPASIMSTSLGEALRILLRFSYASRFDLTGLPSEYAVRHLRLCTSFLKNVRVGRLAVPPDIARLGEVSDLLQMDLQK